MTVALFVISCTKTQKTDNLIVMLVDGCSEPSLAVARLYRQNVDSIPGNLNLDPYICGLVNVANAWSPVTGSSESMSAFMTGVRSGAGYVSMYPGQSKLYHNPSLDSARAYHPLATLLEGAKSLGKSTGMVVTVEFNHATPAACASHARSRSNREAISRQMASQDMDLMYGGGTKFLSDTVRAILSANGTTLIEDDIEAFRSCDDPRQWALFSKKDMDFEIDRDGELQPSLAEMTDKAIKMLARNRKGFFLMVEGSKVDYAAHAKDPATHIKDLLAFDDAVDVALDFAKKNRNTTVVILTDHGTAGMALNTGNLDGYPMRQISDHFGCLPDYKASAAKLSNLIMAAELSEIRGIMKEYTGLDITDEQEKRLKAYKNNATTDYMLAAYDPTLQGLIASMLAEKTNIAFCSGAHTGEDVFLSVYNPAGIRPEGYVQNTDVAHYMEQVLAPDFSLAALTDECFVKASELFEGYAMSVSHNVLTVKSEGHVMEIPANFSTVVLDSQQVKIPSVTVLSRGEFYVNRSLKNMLD